MSNEKKTKASSLVAFLAGVLITLAVGLIYLRVQADLSSKKETTALEESALQTAAEPEKESAEPEEMDVSSEEEETKSEEGIDYAATFPSWNPDSASLLALVDFVSACTDESGEDYLEPAERIATFDMDGTILCEKAPVYVDYCLTMHRVLDDPTFQATPEETKAMQETRDHAWYEGVAFKPEGITKGDLIASAFAGMTPEEFRAYVVDFADRIKVVGFEGMTYGQSFYKPMIEVIDFLRANDFDVWMVSACEREVVRALVEHYDIPYDHVIATDVPYVPSGKEEEMPNDAYTMGQEEKILLGAPLDAVECGKAGKPVAIAREIGRRPVLAFGNSSGDYAMLNYSCGNSKHTGMGFFVVCDDTQREYGSDQKAAEYMEIVEQEGWVAISMANDWKTIYGEGVTKTQLPTKEEPDFVRDCEAGEVTKSASDPSRQVETELLEEPLEEAA